MTLVISTNPFGAEKLVCEMEEQEGNIELPINRI